MSKLILLDAGPLGVISNPNQSHAVLTCRQWAEQQQQRGHLIVVPEIADYEVRRELLRADKFNGIQRLDLVKSTFSYLPITTRAMLKAAQFWAKVRKAGKQTADNLALDADVILAAQAASLIEEGAEVIVATANPRHLSLFVPAINWQSIN